MASIEVSDRGGDVFKCVDLENGYRVPLFMNTAEDIIDIWRKLPDFQCRDDDVMLCSYPKTGVFVFLFTILNLDFYYRQYQLVLTLNEFVMTFTCSNCADTMKIWQTIWIISSFANNNVMLS